MRRARVDLPAPEGPMTPSISPGSTRKARAWTAKRLAPGGAKLTPSTVNRPFAFGRAVAGTGSL